MVILRSSRRGHELNVRTQHRGFYEIIYLVMPGAPEERLIPYKGLKCQRSE
jgi:hypothetical protein